jgi:hypothetical protein
MKNSNFDTTERLRELEGVIGRGKRSFLKVSEALREIRDSGLYGESYTTFEEYCQKRIGRRTDAQAPQISRPSLGKDAFVAYHEAGHAVMHGCLRLRVPGATIVPDGDSAGHVKGTRQRPSAWIAVDRGNRWHRSRFLAEKQVMILQAGEAAQRRYNPRSVRRRHYENDLFKCVALLRKYAPQEKPDARHHCLLLYQWAVSLIEQHWHLIEAVARALLARRELSGSQVRAVIHTANKKRNKDASTHHK